MSVMDGFHSVQHDPFFMQHGQIHEGHVQKQLQSWNLYISTHAF